VHKQQQEQEQQEQQQQDAENLFLDPPFSRIKRQ
jgi:16S rRNA G966 N2-methylase RsmD